jgi:hypothetical protein
VQRHEIIGISLMQPPEPSRYLLPVQIEDSGVSRNPEGRFELIVNDLMQLASQYVQLLDMLLY